MADPIRLYAEFTDDLGTDYRVNIHDADFTGTAGTFKLGADGFVLTYTGNNEDRMQGVIGSELTFTLTEETSIHTTLHGPAHHDTRTTVFGERVQRSGRGK